MHFSTTFIIICAFLTLQGEARSVSSRIIGGEPGFIGQYGFVAALTVETATGRYFCGGSLYSNQWIITAGQCVDGLVLATIQLGSTRLSGDDPNRRTLASSEYFLQPDFNPLTLENDVGIIKLRLPIEYDDYIKQLTPLAMSALGAKADLRAIGWGQTSDSSSALADELQVVRVSSLSNEECKIFYGNQIVDSMVCIVGNYNEGACHGDTGSPLLDAYSRYVNIHVGIASFVSSNGCESTDPSGYTRTYSHVNWIYNVTNIR